MEDDEAGAVDWNVVQVQLDSIGDPWKQPRFDSLPHVVEILTSPNPEQTLQSLREQRDLVEHLVDGVVHNYNTGFSKAIQNYSQILRVFSDSTGKVEELKGDLENARMWLGAQHKQLQQQWSRSVTLRHVISLLDQIDKVAQVPARIEKLAAEKRYYAAVQLHLQSISMLDREGIQSVGALRDVRAELNKLRGALFFKVVEDLHLHLYNKGDYSLNLAISQDKADDISNLTPAPVPAVGSLHPVSRRTRTLTRTVSYVSSVDRTADVRHMSDGWSVDGNSTTVTGIESGGDAAASDRASTNGNTDGMGKEGHNVAAHVLPIWLVGSTPNEFTESMMKSDSPSSVKYIKTMVECLTLLGKSATGGAIISQRVRPAVHELITSEIKARAAAMEASRPRVDQVAKLLRSSSIGMYLAPKQRNGINGSSPVAEWGLPVGKAQTDAHELLESVLDLVSQVLENHVIVGEMMECHENSPQTTANGMGAWSSDTDMSHLEGSGYNLGFVLTVIQSECQLLICDILRATPDATSADAAAQTARLASKALPANAKKQYLRKTNEESHGESEEGLSFAFRFTDTILASPGQTDSLTADTLLHGLNRRKSPPGSQEGYGTAAVLSERGIYLTSAVYRPVLQFMDKMTSLLPPKYTSLVDNNLQSFMENFVKNQFLPIVHVDYRTRVANALASPAAFRLKAYPGAVYETLVEKGRPILQGPMSANHLITEVLGWAQAMPMYASEILELVQTLLDRTLERCRAVYTEAVLGSLSSSIIGRGDMSNLMKQEPAHLLLDVSYLSQLEQKVVVDAPLDTEGLEVEMEMNNLLLSLRPIRQEQLISPNHKMVLLAALSDSLDYMSESVQQLGYNNTSPGSPLKKKNAIHHVAVHHRRMNSALTAGLGVLTEKYHLLSAECLRTLRVELELLAIYHLQGMAGRVYVSDQDAEEPEEFVVALTTQIARIDEEMAAYVPPLKRSYIFGGICSISAAAFIKALNEMQSINMLGVRQICRNCIALQQALVSVSPSSRDFVEERFDRVRTYYECLNLPFEALVAFVTEHDALFSFPEYSSLLKVSVSGRDIPNNAVQRLGRVLAP